MIRAVVVLAAALATGAAWAGSERSPLDRAAVPAPNELKKAEREVQKVWKDRLPARDGEARVALAKDLVEAAKTENDPARRYVLLVLARDQAIEGASVSVAVAALDRLAESYDMAPGAEIADAVVRAAKAAHTADAVQPVCEEAATALEQHRAVLDAKLLDRALGGLRSRAKALAGDKAPSLIAPLDALPAKLDAFASAERALLAAVVKWCEEHSGERVERGECWDLADQAVRRSGADEETLGGYVFGRQLSTKETPRPGDVLVLKDVKARDWSTASWHVAVIASADGLKLRVLHQNWGKKRVVHAHTFDLSQIQSGRWYVFRPVPKVAK